MQTHERQQPQIGPAPEMTVKNMTESGRLHRAPSESARGPNRRAASISLPSAEGTECPHQSRLDGVGFDQAAVRAAQIAIDRSIPQLFQQAEAPRSTASSCTAESGSSKSPKKAQRASDMRSTHAGVALRFRRASRRRSDRRRAWHFFHRCRTSGSSSRAAVRHAQAQRLPSHVIFLHFSWSTSHEYRGAV